MRRVMYCSMTRVEAIMSEWSSLGNGIHAIMGPKLSIEVYTNSILSRLEAF